MARFVYDKAREAFLAASIDITTVTIKVVAVTASYVPNQATDQYLSHISAGYRVATSGALSSKTISAGVFDTADYTFTAITGSVVAALVYYVDTGVEGTSRLVYYDSDAVGLPYTPVGRDLTVVLDNGVNRIFSI